MSVVLHDVLDTLPADDKILCEQGCLSTILYADDTLLIISSPEEPLRRLLAAVADKGMQYDLALRWGNFQLLGVRCRFSIAAPSGDIIPHKESLTYLGITLKDDGRIDCELSRKFGSAWSEFRKLLRLWNHSTMTKELKVHIFQAIVAAQVLYGLSSSWLTTAQVKRLNGFQARCLRRVLRIPASFVSRISNKSVLEQAKTTS